MQTSNNVFALKKYFLIFFFLLVIPFLIFLVLSFYLLSPGLFILFLFLDLKNKFFFNAKRKAKFLKKIS